MKVRYGIFIVLVLLFGLSKSAFCIEEEPPIIEGVKLETIEIEPEPLKSSVEKTKLESIKEAYDKGLRFKFESGPLDEIHIWASYQGVFNFNKNSAQDEFSTLYSVYDTSFFIDGKMSDEKTEFRLMLTPTRNIEGYNYTRAILSDAFISYRPTKETRLILGQVRPKIGMEGGQDPFTLLMINRSQISRTFSNIRTVGLTAAADYDLFDLNLGLYNSTRYMQDLRDGAEVNAWLNLKPLGKTDGKYGKLTLGTGINSGKRDYSYTVTGAYASYEYKKFLANFEYANANGYNGLKNSKNHAQGFYTTLAYKLTPKIQLVTRYDFFNPDSSSTKKSSEYSAGVNYFVLGQRIKLALNYVFQQNQSAPDAHKILVLTQLIF